MVRKKLMWLAVVVVLCFPYVAAACGDQEMSVSITNKTALTAEWTEGDADRTIEVALSPSSLHWRIPRSSFRRISPTSLRRKVRS